MEQREIEKILRKKLSKDRYEHTLGVMYTAAALAMAHGISEKKALYAGLLHDCAKYISNEKQLKMCTKYNIEITAAEQKSPFLLHAKLGAYLAKNKYGITDPEIIHAIRVHTTGVPEMNPLDKVIYIADYIEPNRDKAPNLSVVREMAFQDLDQTMLKILEDTLSYLRNRKKVIDPMTAQTYEYFLTIQNQSLQ